VRLHFPPFGRATATASGDPARWRAVYSFLGVLGIAIVLFLVVALTARLILGR
jgi:hypothetical protein